MSRNINGNDLAAIAFSSTNRHEPKNIDLYLRITFRIIDLQVEPSYNSHT